MRDGEINQQHCGIAVYCNSETEAYGAMLRKVQSEPMLVNFSHHIAVAEVPEEVLRRIVADRQAMKLLGEAE